MAITKQLCNINGDELVPQMLGAGWCNTIPSLRLQARLPRIQSIESAVLEWVIILHHRDKNPQASVGTPGRIRGNRGNP